MKIIRDCCRIIVGIVFIYSGFVKGIDPLGSMYKFTDYFNAFGIGWASTCSLFLSFVLSLAEFLVGTALLFNACTRWAIKGALIFMGIFTPLTNFQLSVFNFQLLSLFLHIKITISFFNIII